MDIMLKITLDPTWDCLSRYGATLKRCCSGNDCPCQGEAICDDEDQAMDAIEAEIKRFTTAEEIAGFLDDEGINHTIEWLP